MTTYGCVRTSTVEQVAGLADQISKLKGAGWTDQSIYQEQVSSLRMEDRVEFAKVLSVLRTGDAPAGTQYRAAARSYNSRRRTHQGVRTRSARTTRDDQILRLANAFFAQAELDRRIKP